MENEKPEYEFIKKWERPDSYIGEQFFEHYIIISHNRDSDPLTESNWDTMIKLLDDNSFEYQIENFNHWAVGWVETIMIHESQTEALEFTEELNRKISEDYPVLDEEDFSEKETKLYNESWKNWAELDYIQAIESKYNIEIDTDKDIKETFDNIAESIGEYWITESNSGYIDIDKIVDSTELEDIMPYLTEESKEDIKHICIECGETVEKLHYNRLCDNCYKPNNDFGLNKTLDSYDPRWRGRELLR